MKKRNKYLPWAASGALFLAACGSISLDPITDADVRARVAADQLHLYAAQEIISGPISFADALARALKYNLDYRLKLMEIATARGLHEVAEFDMLPKVLVSAGYMSRTNDSGGISMGIETKSMSLIPSTSAMRDHAVGSAEFSWNLLDFGLSYYRAKQSADQVMVAEERRRRVMQNIIQDIRAAYWRAVGAQRLVREADDLLERVRAALAKSRDAEAMGLMSPSQALSYQRALLDATTMLSVRRQELQFAKRELAALMNVTPGTDFTLVEDKEPTLPAVPANLGELEDIALENRPELREEDYRKRMSGFEAKRQFLALMPSLGYSIGSQYDSNKFLYNNTWSEGSARVSLNMFKLLSLGAVNRASEAQLANDDARRLALSMAILTQVRVSVQRYQLSLQDLEMADESARVDRRLASYAKAAMETHADSELELIRAEARALNSEFQRFSSYANAQTAYGRIFNSVGVDVMPVGIDKVGVKELSRALGEALAMVERDTFVFATPVEWKQPAVRIRLEYTANARQAADMETAVLAMMKRNQVLLASEDDGKAPVLNLRLELGPARDGVRRANWRIALVDSTGKELGQANYSSILSAQPDANSLRAVAEAAVVSQLGSMRRWLGGQPNGGK